MIKKIRNIFMLTWDLIFSDFGCTWQVGWYLWVRTGESQQQQPVVTVLLCSAGGPPPPPPPLPARLSSIIVSPANIRLQPTSSTAPAVQWEWDQELPALQHRASALSACLTCLAEGRDSEAVCESLSSPVILQQRINSKETYRTLNN